MTTRGMVDPELLEMLDGISVGALTMETLGPARAYMESLVEPLESYARPDIIVETRTIPGPTGAPEIPITLYRPVDAANPLPAYLSIHGGAYLMGTSAFNGRSNVAIAAELGCLVLAVDYRVAPEAIAPAAVEDCYAALAWLHQNAATLRIDPSRIAIGGDSAGGGLAAALALLARDRRSYPVCFQALMYPMLDDRTAARVQRNRHVGEFIWTADANRFAWRTFLGREPGASDVSQYHAPARATDLAALPPAYLGVGALDLFLEESVTYGMRLLEAGVPTEIHVFPGAFHSFDRAPQAAVALNATREYRAALARAFAGRVGHSSSAGGDRSDQ